jgi:hypothetical protein
LLNFQKLNNLASPSQLSSVSHCNSPKQGTNFGDTTIMSTPTNIFQTTNDYLLDTSTSIFLQGQSQRTNILSEVYKNIYSNLFLTNMILKIDIIIIIIFLF